MIDTSLDYARQQDTSDPLAIYREQFHLPPGPDGGHCIYLCGNSLGLQPREVQQLMDEELEAWREHGVEGHFRGGRPWMAYHEQLAHPLAAVAGAKPEEVVAMNTLTVNLHLMMVSFYRPTTGRFRILIEKPAFPSDRYAVASQVRFHGFDPDQALLELAPRDGESVLRDEDIAACIDELGESIALVMLPGVQYYSGQLFDMGALTALARSRGCAVGWDLAHAVGNVPLALHDWDADFAVWCSYKYLNAGPGAVAGAFVHERHARAWDLPRFAGWWGHDKATRFLMGPDFVPMPGAEGWQLSNPPIFSLTPLIASLSLFEDAGTDRLRQKSIALTGYLEALLDERLAGHIRIFTPRDPARRGCQLSLSVAGDRDQGRAVFEAISEAGVVADWREPDVIRIAPVPLYNSYEDVWRFVEILRRQFT